MIWSVLARIPRLVWFSFIPDKSGPYSRFSIQRWIVMLLFWPVFLCYLLITAFCLGLDHWLFPAFKQINIKNPWLVIGIPRSGTTFLHRLLAGDRQRFTTMTLQELIFAPSIVQKQFWKLGAQLDNAVGAPLQKTLRAGQKYFFSGLDGVHSTSLDQPEEDYLGLIPVLYCFLLILPFGDPAFMRLAYFDRDASPKEREVFALFYRRLIQRHLYQRHLSLKSPTSPSELTFLSKNPSFTPFFQTLALTFPDARFVACVRTPNEAVPSQVSSILIGARIFSGRVDPDWWRDNLMNMLRFYYSHLLDNLAHLGNQRHAFVRMEHLAQAPFDTVTNLYNRFDLTMTGPYQQWLSAENTKAQSYRSGHHYLGDALGISANLLGERFDFVYQNLGYPLPEHFET